MMSLHTSTLPMRMCGKKLPFAEEVAEERPKKLPSWQSILVTHLVYMQRSSFPLIKRDNQDAILAPEVKPQEKTCSSLAHRGKVRSSGQNFDKKMSGENHDDFPL